MAELQIYSYNQFMEFIKENGAEIVGSFALPSEVNCPVIEIYKTEKEKYFLHWVKKDHDGFFIYTVVVLK